MSEYLEYRRMKKGHYKVLVCTDIQNMTYKFHYFFHTACFKGL